MVYVDVFPKLKLGSEFQTSVGQRQERLQARGQRHGLMQSERPYPGQLWKHEDGAVANDVGIDCGAFSGGVKVSAQATRSMGGSVGFSASVAQPSTFLMVIWPDASSAQNSMAAVSAEGRTV